MVGIKGWKLLGKVSLQSLRVGLISLFPNEDNLESLCAAKSKLLCLGSFMRKSSNIGLNSKEELGFSK